MIYNSSNNLNDITTTICIKAEQKDWIRTSFFIKFKNNNIPYMVLNKHVLEKNDIITISLPMKGKIVQGSISNNANGKIIFHPQKDIDLCIIKVSDLEYTNCADEGIESMRYLTEDMILKKMKYLN